MLYWAFGTVGPWRVLLLGLTVWIALAPPAVATRAQGVACSTGVLAATLSGTNEVPAVSTSGAGSVRLIVDPVGGVLTSAWGVGGLSSGITQGHIHEAAAGANGPAVVPFAALPSAGGSFSLLTSVPGGTLSKVLANP